MTRLGRLIVPCIVTALLLGCGGPASRDKVVHVAKDDAEMDQAIATARSRLPEFWAAYDQPEGATDFALKVEITDAKGTEFFWVTDLERRDGKLFGMINNDPNIVTSVKYGQVIEVPDDKIADWMFLRGEKMHGNLTLRPLLKTLPKDEADALRAQLAEP